MSRIKISNYLATGTVVWVIVPDKRVLEVYQVGRAVKVFLEKDPLTVEDILPNFTLAIADIFN